MWGNKLRQLTEDSIRLIVTDSFLFTLCLALSILLPLSSDPKADNYTIVLVNSYWILLGLWWFIFQKRRPGPPLPKGKHYLTLGCIQIWQALKQYRKLPYTFVFIFGYFLLADAFNTTITLVSICQNEVYAFSFLQITYLGIIQSSTSIISIATFWYVQRHWEIDAKKMFVVTCIATVLVPLWGMIGIWTKRFGLHRVWEYWVYNALSGLLQAPYYSFSQSIMSELCPPGFEYMFFGLYGMTGRASSVIGPYVIQRMIDDANGNSWMGFPFLFALSAVATLVIWFGVDMEKGRQDAQKFVMGTEYSEARDPTSGGSYEAGELKVRQ